MAPYSLIWPSQRTPSCLHHPHSWGTTVLEGMDHHKPPFFCFGLYFFCFLFFLVGQWMGAMCKFDFPIGRLRGVGEYVMYVVNVAQGTKGLRVKVHPWCWYPWHSCKVMPVVHCVTFSFYVSCLWPALHPSISVSYCSSSWTTVSSALKHPWHAHEPYFGLKRKPTQWRW